MKGELSHLYYCSFLYNLIIYHTNEKRSPRTLPPHLTIAFHRTLMDLKHIVHALVGVRDNFSLFILPGSLYRENLLLYFIWNSCNWTLKFQHVSPSPTFLNAWEPCVLQPLCCLPPPCWGTAHPAFGSWALCNQTTERKMAPGEAIWQKITFSLSVLTNEF